EAYGRGDLSQRSGLGELQDEVGKLARSFDEMADRIQAARKAEEELLANVSHELRTPLARVKLALELIEPRDETLRRRLTAPVEGRVRRAGGLAAIAVRDRGPGIPPEELDRVFDPFFRGEPARAHAGGFGLGLALARRVAEAHGGMARAENAEGGGARIELRF